MSMRIRLGRSLVIGLAAAGALVAVACGDDDDAAVARTVTPSATTTVTAAPAAPAAAAATPGPQALQGEGIIAGEGRFDWDVIHIDRGTKPGITVAPDGSLAIVYVLERMGDAGFIRVASAAAESDLDQKGVFPQGFDITELPGGYVYGPLDVQVDGDGTVAVVYHDHDWQDAAVSVRRDGDWSTTRIRSDGHDGWDDAIAFGPDGSLHVVSVEPEQFGSDAGIEYASFSGGDWSVQEIGSGPQPYEWGTDIAVGADGTVHIVYFDASGRDLVYATNAGGAWTGDHIYSEGDAGRFAQIALDRAGLPHVAFFQADGQVDEDGSNRGAIIYGAFDGTEWRFEQIGSLDAQVLGFEGARRTVALALSGDDPIVAFIDEARLGLATFADGAWSEETVLLFGGAPMQVVGLAIDGHGTPHLTFATTTGNGPLDGEVWYLRPVATAN